MSGKKKQNPSPSANGFKYSDSTGSLASKARAMGEYKLARAGLVDDVEKKIRELIPLFRKENILDEFEKDGADIREGIRSLLGDLFSVGSAWRSYTKIYSTIPLKEYRKLFDQTIISTPIAIAGYKNPAKEIADLTITMINTFDKSRSITSYISFRHSMSDQFKAMYGAMELVNNIANSKAPSKLALTRALDDLSAKADTYLNYAEVKKNNSNDRNLRVTIAKACKSLAEAYKKSEGEGLAANVKDITKNILKDRITYVSSVSKDPAIRKLGGTEEVNHVIDKLMDKDLYTSITQINDYAKAAAAAKSAEVKLTEPKKDAGDGISVRGSSM